MAQSERPGRYRITAHKGLEYETATRQVEVAAGGTAWITLPMERWIDMPALGWFSADDHLHVVRPGPEHDPLLARWMQAEDLNVANLLQMQIYPGVMAATQHGFGTVHQEGETIVASGQENPRTWILGHGIILGAGSYVDFPGDPLSYQRFWDAAARDGALRGYAHWGTGAARDGRAIDAPQGRIEFLEVLQSDLLNHDALYEILSLGIRMTPTAGTDYPCSLTNLPGRDRFYTRVEGPLTYASWLEGLGPPSWSDAERSDVVRALPALHAAIASARSHYRDIVGRPVAGEDATDGEGPRGDGAPAATSGAPPLPAATP